VEGSAAVAVIASGPDSHYSPIHDALFMAINRCEKRLFITTPYFIPSRPLNAAIRSARFRGVDVRIMLPEHSDVALVRYAARSYYPDLLEVGARIFEYQPTMMHAKVMLFDDNLSVIGSANLDSRSFRLNFEASCFVGGSKLNGELAEQFEADQKRCAEITLRHLDELPFAAKLLDASANLLSPMM
jgi:cardiolipin synthase